MDGPDRTQRGVPLRDARQLGAHRRATHHRPRSARLDDRAAMGRRRLRRRVRRADADLRCARRPVRPPAADDHRSLPARRGQPGHRVRRHRRTTHRGPGAHRRRRSDDHARFDGAGVPALRRGHPAATRHHPHLHRRPGRAGHRTDRRRRGHPGRPVAAAPAGERPDRRAGDHRGESWGGGRPRGRSAPRPTGPPRRGTGDHDDRAGAADAHALRRPRCRFVAAVDGRPGGRRPPPPSSCSSRANGALTSR